MINRGNLQKCQYFFDNFGRYTLILNLVAPIFWLSVKLMTFDYYN